MSGEYYSYPVPMIMSDEDNSNPEPPTMSGDHSNPEPPTMSGANSSPEPPTMSGGISNPEPPTTSGEYYSYPEPMITSDEDYSYPEPPIMSGDNSNPKPTPISRQIWVTCIPADWDSGKITTEVTLALKEINVEGKEVETWLGNKGEDKLGGSRWEIIPVEKREEARTYLHAKFHGPWGIIVALFGPLRK
jgi:hypothetical protein